MLVRIGAPPGRDGGLETAMAATAGIGIVICVFQAIAIAGALNAAGVWTVVGLGLVAAVWQLPGWLRELRAGTPAPSPMSWLDKLALAALALVALPMLVAPLAPPLVFDELMYHLPYAREVARTGMLGIDGWLRYPWFPYNFNLVYAGALLLGDDVLPHLLSAFAGGLSVWMVYRLGLLHASRLTGAVAAAVWLGIGDYSSALIDTSVALFVLAACTALWWWHESASAPQAPRWLALAAFFLGVAAGSKYQALTVLPLVAVFVLKRERRPQVLALALVCFLVPCIYWYARNAWLTGDPFNPIGARVFGFTNWNAADYKNQFDDVQAHAAWPNGLLWAVLLAPFGLIWKRSAAVRAAGVFSAYSLFVWALTSRYPRYLTASMPILALVAVLGWQVLFGGLAGGLRRVL
ncbi:MAG TPA: glycosyltransferase family 39 protein, partial [Variovorax sp.]